MNEIPLKCEDSLKMKIYCNKPHLAKDIQTSTTNLNRSMPCRTRPRLPVRPRDRYFEVKYTLVSVRMRVCACMYAHACACLCGVVDAGVDPVLLEDHELGDRGIRTSRVQTLVELT